MQNRNNIDYRSLLLFGNNKLAQKPRATPPDSLPHQVQPSPAQPKLKEELKLSPLKTNRITDNNSPFKDEKDLFQVKLELNVKSLSDRKLVENNSIRLSTECIVNPAELHIIGLPSQLDKSIVYYPVSLMLKFPKKTFSFQKL